MSNILSTSPLDNRHFSADIATKLGDINSAVIIQQLHYWLQKDVGVIIDGIRWIYNSFEAWVKDQFKWLSVWQFRKSMSVLRSLGIVKVIRYKARQWNQTNYYSLNYDRLHKFLGTESSPTEEVKNAESTEIIDLCNNTDQGVRNQHIEVRTGHKSIYDPNSTSVEITAEQFVAASPEKEELKTLCEAQSKVSQPEVTGHIQEKKANSGVGNKSAGQEVSSAKCSIKVINKEWKSHLDQLDSLGVGINATVVKMVKVNQKENVEKAISKRTLRGRSTQSQKKRWLRIQSSRVCS